MACGCEGYPASWIVDHGDENTKKELLSSVFGQNYVDTNTKQICACGIFNFKAVGINMELVHLVYLNTI